MFAYIVRRVLYALPILIGVNLITFTLFFVVNSPVIRKEGTKIGEIITGLILDRLQYVVGRRPSP